MKTLQIWNKYNRLNRISMSPYFKNLEAIDPSV